MLGYKGKGWFDDGFIKSLGGHEGVRWFETNYQPYRVLVNKGLSAWMAPKTPNSLYSPSTSLLIRGVAGFFSLSTERFCFDIAVNPCGIEVVHLDGKVICPANFFPELFQTLEVEVDVLEIARLLAGYTPELLTLFFLKIASTAPSSSNIEKEECAKSSEILKNYIFGKTP